MHRSADNPLATGVIGTWGRRRSGYIGTIFHTQTHTRVTTSKQLSSCFGHSALLTWYTRGIFSASGILEASYSALVCMTGEKGFGMFRVERADRY